ncbi:EpsG family protein [Chitinophaga agri]|uniref:EpsG family protein n=1 Tax=Chitinophaga agri TaxID=2703787 RepID=A0A6B9ZHT0_9BACT|nr:EpsG family protein [Chitinophaga agri]QHS61998.1 EpsG family protein [Chitinophaga agri]
MLYQIISILLSVFAFFESLHVNVRKLLQAAYLFTLAFFILFAGTRMVGFDYQTYTDIFNYSSSGQLSEVDIEIGWSSLCYLFSGAGFNTFLLFIACCSVSLYGVFFKQYSPYVFLSLLIYYSTYFIVKEMGQMRQGLAIAVATLAFTVSMKKNMWQFIALFLFAFSIHYSAIVLLPVYYLCNHPWKTNVILIFTFLGFCFIYVDVAVVISKVIGLLPISGAQEKVANLLVSDILAKKLGLNSSTILRLIIMLLMLRYRTALKERFPFFEAFVMLYFYGLMLYLVFNSLSEFAQRTSAYFRILEAVVLPCILVLVRDRKERLIIIALLVLNSVVSVNRLFSEKTLYDYYNPYKTYLLD